MLPAHPSQVLQTQTADCGKYACVEGVEMGHRFIPGLELLLQSLVFPGTICVFTDFSIFVLYVSPPSLHDTYLAAQDGAGWGLFKSIPPAFSSTLNIHSRCTAERGMRIHHSECPGHPH